MDMNVTGNVSMPPGKNEHNYILIIILRMKIQNKYITEVNNLC